MKIGILTFTDGTNYGQRLQNYALQELLASYGNDVYTIKQEHHYSIKHRVKVAINNIAHIKQAVIQNKRKNVFDRFNNRYIKFYDQLLPENGRGNLADEFDLFIAGSDQIWNPNSPFVNSNMFMQFAPKQKRATYAASFSVDEIPNNKREEFSRWIGDIDYVSVRELQAVKLVEELSGKKPVLSLDPTLLLDHQRWENIAEEAQSTVEFPDFYMISLFLGNDYTDEEKEIAKQTGLHLMQFKDFETAAPDEFLKIIKNASLVLTDSYHVTIFVLIHSLGGFEYSTGYNTAFVILRQIINCAVATFVFMAGYFVNVDALSDEKFSHKNWIIYRGAAVYPICDLVAVV